MIERSYKDQDMKIQEFEDASQKLRSDLDTGMIQQAVFVTSKILDNTDTLGTGLLLVMIPNLTWCRSASRITEAIPNGCFISFIMLTWYKGGRYQ